jgi:hypothetical protein
MKKSKNFKALKIIFVELVDCYCIKDVARNERDSEIKAKNLVQITVSKNMILKWFIAVCPID